MREEPQISSLHNPKVKHAVKLRDRRDRDRNQEFLIEGYRELLRAVDAGQPINVLFFCEALFLGSNEFALIDRVKNFGAQLLSCSEEVFHKLSYRDRPDGLVAIAPQMTRTLQDLEKSLEGKRDPLLIIAEAIEKPGNLGTILRSADAVGADGVIVCDRCTDIYNPNVVRASVGTLFTLPVIEAAGEELLSWLKKRGIKIVAATPHAEQLYTEVSLKGPLAFVVGREQLGLSEKWMSSADIQLRIPMRGIADSLNVATATTVLLYEALRQRL